MLAVATVIGSLYAWRGGETLLFLLAASGVLMLGGMLLQLLGPHQVAVAHSLSPVSLAAGDTLTVEVRVSFKTRLPLPWMVIFDQWSGGQHQQLLFPGFRRSLAFTYQLQDMPRGIHRLHRCSVSWGDMLSLFTGGCQSGKGSSFKVRPRPLYIGGAVSYGSAKAGDMTIGGRTRNYNAEAGEIREYAPGDPLSRIHWKNSARKGTLQSRVPEREGGRMSCIVLANSPGEYEIPYGALAPRSRRGAGPAAFERAVSAAMGLLLAAEQSGSYVQLFSGGWPEGVARHEGLGQIPGRVQDMLTEISPDGGRPLGALLEDASRSWIPGMTVAVITGRLDEESARTLARFLVQGVKVELYYVWDQPAPEPGGGLTKNQAGRAATIGAGLTRLGACLYCLGGGSPSNGDKGVEIHGFPERTTLG
ncbi:DUF58 domain-containing protein [Paenibacillus sp. S150]|uniref:DUF58 domain-containing protein n=1 Tax=Paenibacillus sp. S150 TaxID=2749826 RepID=UPI001C5A0406|nr:DUF58 domain-containing protein [Paenibacillus sp. S150]MBW4085026.1 DUF58 domain-containing protein [Paenibacillus sp. S150]